MAMMKAGIAGAMIGALALATLMFVAPIAAQAPGGPSPSDAQGSGGPGGAGPRGPDGPGMRSMEPGRGRGTMGQGMTGGRGRDLDDADITGPRGGVAMCQERLSRFAQWRVQRVERLVRPTDEQRTAFEDFKAATGKAAEILSAACPADQPLTPTAQLAAAEKRIEARLEAIRTVRPALEAFYQALSDEQKIRWSVASQPGGNWRDRGRRWREQRGEGRGDGRWSEQNREYGGMPWRGEGGDRWGDRRGPWGDRWGHDRWSDRGGDRWGHDRGGDRGGDRWGNYHWRDRALEGWHRGGDAWRDRERRSENLWRDQGNSGRQPYRWRDQDRMDRLWRERFSRDEHNRASDPEEERL